MREALNCLLSPLPPLIESLQQDWISSNQALITVRSRSGKFWEATITEVVERTSAP